MRTTVASIALLLPTIVVAIAVPANCGTGHPTFTFEHINLTSYYTYVTPSATGPKAGYFDFVLKNSDVDYAMDCKGVTSMPLGQFHSYQKFDCKSPANEESAKGSFSYDSSTKTLSLEASWTCDGGMGYTAKIVSEASLKCETTTWKNPSWKLGEVYSKISTVCQPNTLVISL